MAAGCFVFCSRGAFEATGGFDERLFATEELAFSRALRRYGRVVILRERVVSSGRKLRTHSLSEFWDLTSAAVLYGSAALRTRERLAIWYGERRNEPGPVA